MTTPQVQLDVCKIDGSLLPSARVNDAVLRATTPNQRLLLGVQGTSSVLSLASNVVSIAQSLGVNTSNPLAALDVRGSAIVSGFMGINVDSNTNLINSNAYGLLITHSNDAIRFGAVGPSGSNTLLTLSSNVIVHGGELIMNSFVPSTLIATSNAFNLNHASNIILSTPLTGVNTSNPQYTLDIAGTTRAVAFRLESNTNVCTIGFNDTTNNLDIRGLTLTSNNYVGISQPTPTYTLDIGGGASDSNSVVRINTGNMNPNKLHLTNQGPTGPRVWASNNQLALITPGIITFNTSNQEAVRIDTSGNLGVGKAPGHKLDVVGDINFTGILRKNGDEYFAGVPGWSNAPNAIYTYCNVGFGTIPDPNYMVDVNGDLNVTGNIMLNGYQFLNGGLTSNFQAVTRFQVAPTNAVFMASNVAATIFDVVVPGNVAATPQNITVNINGMKLSYVDANNYDYTLTSTSVGGTTVFTVTLTSPLNARDVLDITIWPYIPGNKGVFVDVSNVDILSGDKSGWTACNNNVYIIGSNVGIGTSNPRSTLDVRGTDAILIPSGTTGQRPVATTGMIRYNTQLNTFEGFGAGNAWGSLGGVKDTNQDTYISAESFPNSNDDTIYFINSNIERMRITRQGNVGIGTSNPSYMLDVAGTGYFREDLTINSNLAVNRSISMQGVYIRKSQGGPANFSLVSVPGLCNDLFGNVILFNQTTQASQGVIFAARNFPQFTLTELGRFTGDGRFGVGRSNPTEAADIVGNIRASSNIYSMQRLGVGTSNPLYPLHVAAGSGSTSIFAAGDITGLSDASVKTDLRVIEGALEKLRAISGYTFVRTDDTNPKRHAGVIAQEVKAVLPEVVTEDNGKLCVAYGNMIALLIEAIKELDNKLTLSLLSASNV